MIDFLSTNHFTGRWVSVHGLNHHEMRLLAEKVSDQPETLDTGDKLVEFSLPSWQVSGNQSIWNPVQDNCVRTQLLESINCSVDKEFSN